MPKHIIIAEKLKFTDDFLWSYYWFSQGWLLVFYFTLQFQQKVSNCNEQSSHILGINLPLPQVSEQLQGWKLFLVKSMQYSYGRWILVILPLYEIKWVLFKRLFCYVKALPSLRLPNTVVPNWESTMPCLCCKFPLFKMSWWMLRVLPQLSSLESSLPYLRAFQWGTLWSFT